MASITIRNLDGRLKAQLRLAAASHGHSMGEEVERILREALNPPKQGGLGSRIRERFAATGGIELELPARRDDARTPDRD